MKYTDVVEATLALRNEIAELKLQSARLCKV